MTDIWEDVILVRIRGSSWLDVGQWECPGLKTCARREQEEQGQRHSHKKGTERIMKILLLQKNRKESSRSSDLGYNRCVWMYQQHTLEEQLKTNLRQWRSGQTTVVVVAT
mmetsp:Transcript_50002/g.97869  ORF Transcript_50002/g.97869 Transcript_50002/m.97869 type:complete len:110 (+) Transcript_50002:75-404(+)